jgi:hypothetical protein
MALAGFLVILLLSAPLLFSSSTGIIAQCAERLLLF